MTVRAVFENGVFRPKETVSLPEHTEVNLEFGRVEERLGVNLSPEGMDKIREILGTSYDDPASPGNLAECHNEHQP